MAVSFLLLGLLATGAWVAAGGALALAFSRGTSSVLFRLTAGFLAGWALFATTTFLWILAHGGGSAVVELARTPLALFAPGSVDVWIEGAVGAFGVFLVAFLLSQAVGRGFLLVGRPRPLAWPQHLSVPETAVSLLAFPSDRADALTFTLLEHAGGLRFRRRDVILVSDALLSRLAPEEREAVIAHELGHRRELDGRYLTFFRTLSRMMRWDPVLAFFADQLTRREEYRADLDAVELTRRPRALARALFKANELAAASGRSAAGLLGVGGARGRRQTLERIRRLLVLAESGRFPDERAG